MRIAMGVVVGVFVTTVVTGQAQRRPATLDDLLSEVQALRADLKDSATASLRTQALVARVSLQEQRLEALSTQLNDAHAQLATVVEERTEQGRRLEALQVRATGESDQNIPQAEIAAIEAAIAAQKLTLAQSVAKEARLRAQVGDLSALVIGEQDRWVDFNNRLDALEMSLQPPR